MAGLTTVMRKEFKNLYGGGKSSFIVYAVMSALWSFMLLSAGDDAIADNLVVGGRLWLVFFSVIVTATFAATVFISERVSGTLEALITSGLSRDAVLFGKTLFVIVMASAIGLLCAMLAGIWGAILPGFEFSRALGAGDALAYLAATFFNAAASAYLSVRMGNPRFLHFANLFMTGALIGLYSLTSALFDSHPSTLILGFSLAGAIFMFLARREFAGERIIRPIIF